MLSVLSACGPAVGGGSSDGQGGTATDASTMMSASDEAGTATASSAQGTGAPTDTGKGDDTPPLPTGCECSIVPSSSTCDGAPYVACEAELLCPPLETTCDRPQGYYGCSGQEIVVDAEAMSCALDALARRTPGRLQLVETLDTCGLEGCSVLQSDLAISADGRVIEWSCEADPLFEGSSMTQYRDLLEPEHFVECQGEATTGGQFACMLDGLRSGGSVVCPQD